jgi:hypothetical protein
MGDVVMILYIQQQSVYKIKMYTQPDLYPNLINIIVTKMNVSAFEYSYFTYLIIIIYSWIYLNTINIMNIFFLPSLFLVIISFYRYNDINYY